MRKTIKLLVLALTVFCIMAALPLTASAADGGKVIYENHFEGTEIDETMWYNTSGTAEIAKEFGESYLRCRPKSNVFKINFGPAEAENVDVEFKLRARANSTNSSARLTVYFRSISIPANESFSYQLRFNGTKLSLVHVNNHKNTTATTLTEDPNLTIKQGLWYNVKLSLRDHRIVVYVNGTKYVDMEDDTYPAMGGFGFSSNVYTMEVDDLVITQYNGSKLPEPTANEVPVWVGREGTDEEAEIYDTGEERLNFFGSTDEKKDTSVFARHPDAMTLGRWIAVAMAALTVLAAGATVWFFIIFKKSNKKEGNQQ
ncbi:MAG: hypothetical protein J6B93_04320 [Clostridia bacterium]|nr:hypothetical protein [Clostridia bacterium]